MSQENVEVVQAAFAAWSARDMDALRALLDPHFILRVPEGWPDPGPFIGREAAIDEWKQAQASWETNTLEPTSDFIDAADRVAVRFIWRGVGGGPDSHLEFTGVYTVRKGRILYQDSFWDHGEALELLGPSEQDARG